MAGLRPQVRAGSSRSRASASHLSDFPVARAAPSISSGAWPHPQASPLAPQRSPQSSTSGMRYTSNTSIAATTERDSAGDRPSRLSPRGGGDGRRAAGATSREALDAGAAGRIMSMTGHINLDVVSRRRGAEVRPVHSTRTPYVWLGC